MKSIVAYPSIIILVWWRRISGPPANTADSLMDSTMPEIIRVTCEAQVSDCRAQGCGPQAIACWLPNFMLKGHCHRCTSASGKSQIPRTFVYYVRCGTFAAGLQPVPGAATNESRQGWRQRRCLVLLLGDAASSGVVAVPQKYFWSPGRDFGEVLYMHTCTDARMHMQSNRRA